MQAPPASYAAHLKIDYPARLDRLSTFFRIICILPIAIILGLLSGNGTMTAGTGEQVVSTGGGSPAGSGWRPRSSSCPGCGTRAGGSPSPAS